MLVSERRHTKITLKLMSFCFGFYQTRIVSTPPSFIQKTLFCCLSCLQCTKMFLGFYKIKMWEDWIYNVYEKKFWSVFRSGPYPAFQQLPPDATTPWSCRRLSLFLLTWCPKAQIHGVLPPCAKSCSFLTDPLTCEVWRICCSAWIWIDILSHL